MDLCPSYAVSKSAITNTIFNKIDMKTITRKVFSLCSDFKDREDLYNELSKYSSCDTYIDYIANTKETLESQGYSNDEVANKLVELGAKDGEEVLIHIDY